MTVQVDKSLPLHEYGIQDDGKLSVDRPYIFLTLMNKNQSEKTSRKVTKTMTVRDLKDMIVELFREENEPYIVLFATKDEIKYLKLTKKDIPVGEVLSGDEIVCYFEDNGNYNMCWPVKRDDTEIGKVFGYNGDIVRTVKLRVQDQMGIPASCITVKNHDGECVEDIKLMGAIYTINVETK